jgi:hypothetical protein
MLQPDLFFAYSLSSGLALAASKKLKDTENPMTSKYFMGTILWLSFLYVPQIFYLLWSFPAWESMFVFKELADIPAWFISIYIVTIMTMGTLGFYITSTLIKKNNLKAAVAQVGWSSLAATIIISVGWDGTGYERLLYTGTGAEWASGVDIPLTDFFTSNILMTLIWLETLVLAPYSALFIKWARAK